MIGFFIANIFECSNATYLVQAYMDLATDAVIVALPMPIVWKLRLSTKKRWGLTFVFLLGAITTAASAWRAAIQHFTVKWYAEGRGQADVFCKAPKDVEYTMNMMLITPDILTPSIYSAIIEAGLGITGACLPLLRPLVRLRPRRPLSYHWRWHKYSKRISDDDEISNRNGVPEGNARVGILPSVEQAHFAQSTEGILVEREFALTTDERKR